MRLSEYGGCDVGKDVRFERMPGWRGCQVRENFSFGWKLGEGVCQVGEDLVLKKILG